MEDLYLYVIERYKKNLSPLTFDEKVPGFFNYYFRQAALMRRYNEKYGFLKIPYFSRSIELKSSFHAALRNFFSDYILPVRKYLDEIINKGWRLSSLSVRSYNLVVFFADLCKMFETVISERALNHKSFLKFEDLFLKFSKTEDNIVSVAEALVIYLKSNNKFNDDVMIDIEKLKPLFSGSMIFPSMFDLFLSYNIFYYKKHFLYSDLYSMDYSDIVSSDFYNCPKEVFDEIVYKIESLLKEIKRLEKVRENLQWLKDLTAIPPNTLPERIVSFYDSGERSWDLDKNDFFKLFLNIMQGLLERLDALIYKDVALIDSKGGGNNFKLLNNPSFELLYQKIYNDYYQTKARFMSTVTSRVSLDDFIEAENPDSIFNESQISIYEKIKGLLKGISEMSLKINNLIVTDSFIVKNSERNRYMLTSPEEVKGKSPHQAVYYYLELFLQVCGCFKEEGIRKEVLELDRIVSNVNDAKKELSRISDRNNLIEKKLVELGKV